MSKEDRREYMREYMRKWFAVHREEHKEYRRKWRADHKEEVNTNRKKRKDRHREEHNASKRKYNSEDLNNNGVTKSCIRVMSRKILDKCHAKLYGYEIHHCFGYEDANKFIYIPRELHLKIHQLLRDKNISAEEDHWMEIRELVNECKEYTYIRT